MNSYVYSSSPFWLIIDKLSIFALWFYPLAMIIASVFWVRKFNCKSAWCALLGSFMCAVSKLTHWQIDTVQSVGLGYMHPHVEENIIIWFFYMHGINFGIMTFCISVAIFFVKKNNA